MDQEKRGQILFFLGLMGLVLLLIFIMSGGLILFGGAITTRRGALIPLWREILLLRLPIYATVIVSLFLIYRFSSPERKKINTSIVAIFYGVLFLLGWIILQMILYAS
ncbi:MAG: hypothetical protein NWF08_05265 [Candidatus Bathyarchaeota archaeon]|nr:hypothetical protein [Candidatus Bathyarchaeota archaeon]